METTPNTFEIRPVERKPASQPAGLRAALRPALFLALVLLGAAAALAQGTTGTISGTVTDSTGAVVPGATVTVTQTATNTVHTVTSSEAGTYSVPALQPGPYKIKVQMPGFQSFEQKGIVLQIDQELAINAPLAAGAQDQVVEVTTSIPVVQTSDSSVGLVVDQQAITNIPLNGRLGLMGLIALAPGVQGAGAQDQLATRGVTAAIGTGARNSYGGLGSTLDGVTNQEVALQRGEGEIPSLGAIAEFKVLVNAAPAEFNQPAQIIVASAGGTNQYHGKLLEYNRSKGMGAKSVFGGALPRPPYQRNEYAVHFNGPITVPHLYQGRDKSFFFFAFEGFRLTQSFSDNTTQPTVLERSGNFSEFLAGGACEPTVHGVPTPTLVKNPATGVAYPGNIVTNAINPVSSLLLNKLYPTPTVSGCGVNTIQLVQELSAATRTSVRVDHRLGPNDQLRFTWLRAFYGPSPTNGTDSLQGGNALDGEHNSNFIVGWTHTFTPSLLLDLTGSYFHLPIYRTPQNYKTKPLTSTIIPGLGAELIDGAPSISITNITNVGESGSKDLEQDGQLNGSVTKVLARHTVKAGFSYLFDDHWVDTASSPQRGSYSFNGQYSGLAFADFYLGYPNAVQAPTPNNYIVRQLSSQAGFYVQDDWKFRPNFTVNAGIRYDFQHFWDNPYGNNSLYVPSLNQVVVFGKSMPSTAITSFVTALSSFTPSRIALASSVGLPSNVWSYLGQPNRDIAPRLGFAYEVRPNTVIRGAFGIYFNLMPPNYVDAAPFANLPFAGTASYTNSTTFSPTATYSLSTVLLGSGAFPANPTASAQHKTVVPYTEEYNLTVERQLPGAFDLRIGYVGQHNVKQSNPSGPGTTNPNLQLQSTQSYRPQIGVTAQSNNPVQPFGSLNQSFTPFFHSSENSLQVGVHKQYVRGTSFGAEYQWTRVLGTENIEDPSGLNPSDSYGPIGGITPQVLAVNYSYELPFGKNKWLLANKGDLVDKLVSGWQFTGISTFQTGQPFSVTYSAPGRPVGQVSGRASIVPGVPFYPAKKTRAEWFNPAAFQAPPCVTPAGVSVACSTFVNVATTPMYATYGNSGYDMLRGPAYQDWDLNLEKNTSFHERYKLQLRADSFNIFNHPDFAPPNAAISNTSSVGTITNISSTPAYEPRTVEFAAKFSF